MLTQASKFNYMFSTFKNLLSWVVSGLSWSQRLSKNKKIWRKMSNNTNKKVLFSTKFWNIFFESYSTGLYTLHSNRINEKCLKSITKVDYFFGLSKTWNPINLLLNSLYFGTFLGRNWTEELHRLYCGSEQQLLKKHGKIN